jgi:rSAM/selenodomain-associated transferase 1
VDYIHPEARVLVFCKAPEPGKVKTRLAESIGDDLAAKLHAKFAEYCLAWVSRSRLAPVDLWCWPTIDEPFFIRCKDEYGVELKQQVDGDLGAKMLEAFTSTLHEANYAVAIGTDCPVLDVSLLSTALQSLAQKSHGVIAPAEDGGYVLLGLRQLQHELFQDMPWSQTNLMAKTRAAMSGQWKELPTLWDVDRLEDLRRLKRTLQQEVPIRSLYNLLGEIPDA